MTTAESQAAPPAQVVPEPDTRLDQLAAEYAALKPLADEYAARLKAITDGIKAELSTAAPGETKVLLHSSYLAKPLQLSARFERRVNAKKLQAELPDIYEQYAPLGAHWRLEQVR